MKNVDILAVIVILLAFGLFTQARNAVHFEVTRHVGIFRAPHGPIVVVPDAPPVPPPPVPLTRD